ncbi:hypothetical protein KKD52_04475 [Myxococcota bacterium]|nr:hypothetical protein [Myxococcota bacterium]MBU1411929.1 hypothetical protein [Myxococcota bacterium]MBU1509599.1 hypothetical protein [Myxococcota bacterium]
MNGTHCMEQGREALTAGKTNEARVWFEKAAALEPENAEAQLQHALCALMTGDRRTFTGIYASFREKMETETSPRLVRLWNLVLRFSGSLAMVATAVTLSSAACSNGTKEGTTAAKPDEAQPMVPVAGNNTTEPTPPEGDMIDPAPMDDEVYSKHRYSAGVRPPIELEPEAKTPPVPPMSKPGDSASGDTDDDDDDMEAGMKPTPMRPPATKYGVQMRYGGGLRDTDL